MELVSLSSQAAVTLAFAAGAVMTLDVVALVVLAVGAQWVRKP